MKSNGLILTLGHGASAILILDNTIINGYQLERLTGIKGDSRFPSIAIEEISKFDEIPEGIDIYISHWEPSGNVFSMNSKHFNPNYLAVEFPNSKILSTTPDLTHHDTHAFSALAYNKTARVNSHIIVADGFGTAGEVMSFYRVKSRGLELLQRVYGYNQSLGLLYQYATDYVGLRQNRDEWKLNAKATHCSPGLTTMVRDMATEYARSLVHKQANYTLGKDDPMTSLGALSHTHHHVVQLLQDKFLPDERPEIALFLQTVVEACMAWWISSFRIKDLTVVGGCFLNVQLNGHLAQMCDSFCAMPLSGDEGAGLGLFKYYNGDFDIPNDLCFGKRKLRSPEDVPQQMFRFRSIHAFKSAVEASLMDDCIVNVVLKNMEYGPRAYCHTSTLALPTAENRRYINHLNDRDMDMPMCPTMTREQYSELFTPPCEVNRSVEHMILALPYNDLTIDHKYDGIYHQLLDGTVTGRPQVVDPSHWVYPVCKELGPLINTSFNNHGHPICYDMSSVMDCHNYMLERDTNKRVTTIVLINDFSDKSDNFFKKVDL